jgi:hypothetical protein
MSLMSTWTMSPAKSADHALVRVGAGRFRGHDVEASRHRTAVAISLGDRIASERRNLFAAEVDGTAKRAAGRLLGDQIDRSLEERFQL